MRSQTVSINYTLPANVNVGILTYNLTGYILNLLFINHQFECYKFKITKYLYDSLDVSLPKIVNEL